MEQDDAPIANAFCRHQRCAIREAGPDLDVGADACGISEYLAVDGHVGWYGKTGKGAVLFEGGQLLGR